MKLFIRLLRYIKPYVPQLIMACICMAVFSVCNILIMPLVSKISTAVGGKDFPLLAPSDATALMDFIAFVAQPLIPDFSVLKAKLQWCIGPEDGAMPKTALSRLYYFFPAVEMTESDADEEDYSNNVPQHLIGRIVQ